MQVVVKKPYGRFSKGHVFTDMPANQARSLIARGLIREVGEVEEKSMRSPADRMMKKYSKK